MEGLHGDAGTWLSRNSYPGHDLRVDAGGVHTPIFPILPADGSSFCTSRSSRWGHRGLSAHAQLLPDEAFFWERLRQSALAFAAPLLLVFAFQYQRSYRSRDPRLSSIVLILPLATLIVLWGEQVIPLHLAEWSMAKNGFLTVPHMQYGPWFYAAGSLLLHCPLRDVLFPGRKSDDEAQPVVLDPGGNVIGASSQPSRCFWATPCR
ncbi:MAG: hypothetical protein IPK19_04770 [Chloroflexi bacterium]|nr:hypothetical protein [Chloroflexota bacterium]